MIGVDTNIVVRLLLKDDLEQYELACDLVKSANANDPLILNPIVLAEISWILESRLKQSVLQVRKLVWQLIDTVEFHLPETMSFFNAKEWYQSTHTGISDVMIASINAEYGCRCTKTFDRRAAKYVEGMELLK